MVESEEFYGMCCKTQFHVQFTIYKVRLAVQPLNQEILNLKDEELQGNVRKE